MPATLTTPQVHQKRIAIDTLKMSDAGARIMGGMSKPFARAFLVDPCGWTAARIAKLEGEDLAGTVRRLCSDCSVYSWFHSARIIGGRAVVLVGPDAPADVLTLPLFIGAHECARME